MVHSAALVLIALIACGDRGAHEPAPDPTLPGVRAPSAALDRELRAVLAATGSKATPAYVNRLIRELSPYLLQHAHNPVSWYAWGEEALARARREQRPIFLSIGYSTCHWCHVMERESFEDDEVARVLNASYLAIKVDREERPDLDQLYMDAVQAMGVDGGWPLTVILTPDTRPFYAGTYFPRAQLLGELRRIADLWRTDRASLTGWSQRVTAQLARPPASRAGLPQPEAIVNAVRVLARRFDRTWGGSGTGTKFPQPSTLALLLQYHRRSRDPAALAHVVLTLDKMAAGGIRDHVGGGFHRYTVDRAWHVPHFEKMLYDNAQLANLYLDAARAAVRPDFEAIAVEILEYLQREMTSPEGALWSASDADSAGPHGEQVEGYAFTWTLGEITAAAGADAPALLAFHGVTAVGTLEGRSVLTAQRPAAEVAAQLGITEAALREQLVRGRQALLAARQQRPRPHVDDKIIAAWNGLAISAFARGALLVGREDFAVSARRAAEHVLGRMRDADGRLRRTFRAGRAGAPAMLDDHAFVIHGLLDLFEATTESRWLDAAIELQAQQDARYLDDPGGYFRTAVDAERLLVRDKPLVDGAEPSGNAVALRNLVRLELLTGNAAYRERAEAAFTAFAAELGAGSPAVLAALDALHDSALEIVLVAKPGSTELAALLAEVRAAYLPNRIIVRAAEADVASLAAKVPVLEDKRVLRGTATAFVCERWACRNPTSDPAELRTQLARTKPLAP